MPLDLETATVGSRGIAYVIDIAILLAGLLLIGLAEAAFGFGGFVPGWFGLALLLLLGFALLFGYPIGFETLWRGRTPGKAAMGLRVVTVEGAPVGVRHAAIRATIALFELLATLGAIAVIASFASSRGQRLGDLAAGTLVVRERRARAAVEAEWFAPPPGLEAHVAQLDVSALGAADYATIRDTLRRLPALAPATRDRIAGEVAGPLVARVTPGPPRGVPPSVWLQCVAAAVQARRGSGVPEATTPTTAWPRPSSAPGPPTSAPTPAPGPPTPAPGPPTAPQGPPSGFATGGVAPVGGRAAPAQPAGEAYAADPAAWTATAAHGGPSTGPDAEQAPADEPQAEEAPDRRGGSDTGFVPPA